MDPTKTRPVVGLVTLGCDKNTVDMEHVAGLLARGGCDALPLGLEVPEDAAPAPDAVVILTCGFVADAKVQSVETVVEWAERKKRTGAPARLYVAGCLAQRHGSDLFGAIPEIDGMLGVGQMARLAEMVRKDHDSRRMEVPDTPDMTPPGPLPRRALETAPHRYLKIADGCDHTCAFCAIPAMKGAYHSVPKGHLLDEARRLLRDGARELVLIAQDTTLYGTDLYDDYRLPELLGDLCGIRGDFRVRLLYAYPGGISPRLLEVMADEPKIARYLDIPLQHLDPGVLRKMRRPGHRASVGGLVARIRRALPDAALRTTMITGLPGETPRAFRALVQGVKELRFEWLGAFAYSPEEGTPAAVMGDQVPKATRERRRARLLEAQAQITAEFNAFRVGKTLRVLVEGVDSASGRAWGRSGAEAPDIDGQVWIANGGAVPVGDFAEVKITRADIYDIEGRA